MIQKLLYVIVYIYGPILLNLQPRYEVSLDVVVKIYEQALSMASGKHLVQEDGTFFHSVAYYQNVSKSLI